MIPLPHRILSQLKSQLVNICFAQEINHEKG